MRAGESPLAGPHRALDGIGRFADPDDLRALRVVSKQFNAHSRLPAAIKRCFEKRWAARSVSKRARWRLEAVEAMGRCLGVDAEEFLTKTLKGDKLQAVRAASARWLARIARRAAPETKKRIFAAACLRYDEERGRMNVRQAIERERRREARRQAWLQANGRCVAGFAWIPLGGGSYRCAGGTHFMRVPAQLM